MMGRLLRGGAALVTLIALVAGLPVALFLLAGNPLPSHIPSWHEATSLLLHRDNGSVFLGAVRDLSWLAWAAFTASAVVEVQAALRGRRPPRLRLGGLQNAAGWLVALSTLAFSSQPAVALASTPPAPVAAVTAVHPETGVRDPQVTSPPASQVMSMGFYQMVTVHRGDCLWTIAQRYLGDGDRFREIVKLNLGHHMAGGQVFTDPAVIWAGWVLQLPARSSTTAATPTATPSAPAAHSGHASADPQFSSPHPGASAAGASVPAQPSAPAQEGTAPPSAPAQAAPAHAASAPATASRPAAAAEIPPAVVFGAGVLVGGATVALARMRRRQRQARRFGRRIPVPASAPVITAERRLRAAEEFDPEAAPLLLADAEYGPFYAADEPPGPAGDLPFYPDDADEPAWHPAYHHAGGGEDHALRQAYPSGEPGPAHPVRSGRGQVTALRAALSQLGSGLVAAGQPIPEISGVRVHRSGLELLLDSPAGEPPPLPFVVPGGRQGMAWQLELPRQVPLELADTGDLLPGLLTAGTDPDGGYLLIDLEQLQVTTVDGPPDLAERVLATAAMELTTSQLAGWYDLILAGFPELGAVDGRATSCDSLGEALDLLATKAVALRRRLGDTERADLRRRRLADPGDEDWALTLLVSRTAPSIGQMAMLLDLASAPGGVAALVAGGTAIPNGHPAPASFRLADDPARPGEIVGHLFPLRLDVTPQPLTRADYEALASLFATAADLQDVPADEPPYGRWSWPPAPGLAGLQEPPDEEDEPGLGGVQEAELPGHEDPPEAAPAADAPPILRIGVMGAFTINGAPAALQPAQSQLVLALALNGQEGLSNGQLCYLLGPDPDHPKPSDSLRQLIVRTRRQLGRTLDGREWIEHLGAGQYALHPDAKLDWAEFEDLSEQGLRGRDRGCLRDALALIRGKPFTGCYHWWLDLAFTETVRAQIVDTAELLAELELAAGDPSASARAARTGLAGDASAEQLWRALMRAEHAAGNLAGVREAWSRCLDTMADISADGEPHPDTAALYQRLISGDRVRSYP
ncbi:MAG TPA: BTAD domain-containing putative transcriptional regulator [Streptosporangiaceae bacterium]